MKVAIDAFGGDNAPLEIVKGAITAVNLIEDLQVVLVGKRQPILDILNEYGYQGDKIEILEAYEVITNEESPTTAIRTKKNSTIVVGCNRLKDDDDVIAFISAGSTGAILSGGVFIVGRMAGVMRPALAPTLPNVKGGQTLLIDCGANVDCKPEYLVQFAQMGTIYMQNVCGIENPKVGLLNIGAEDKKGNTLTHEAFPLLSEAKKINFVGNVEARDLLSGDVDVIVADGFAGNIALKASEGAIKNMSKLLKTEIKNSGVITKLGAGMMKGMFKRLKKNLDYNLYGGTAFLGVNKIVLKTHGTATAETILSCALQVKQIHESGIIAKLKESFAENL